MCPFCKRRGVGPGRHDHETAISPLRRQPNGRLEEHFRGALLPEATNAQNPRANDAESTLQFSSVVIDPRSHDFRFAPRVARPTGSGRCLRFKAPAKNHFSKILVCGQQQSGFGVGRCQDNIVGKTGGHLGNIPHVMTILPKAFNNLTVNTFIREEIHAVVSATG